MRRALLAIPLAAALLTTFTPAVANAAGTAQFNLSVSSGRPGIPIGFSQEDPCPAIPAGADYQEVQFSFTDANGVGTTLTISNGSTDADGNWTYGGGMYIPYRWAASDVDPPVLHPEAAVGTALIGAKCVLSDGTVSQEYAPQPFNVTGPSYAFKASAASVQPGANITVDSVDACPGDRVTVTITDAHVATNVDVTPNSSGAWSVTMPASYQEMDGTMVPYPAGPALLRAYCLSNETGAPFFGYADVLLTIGNSTPPVSCKDTLFIGVAGSGQHYKTDTDLSVSPEVKRVYDSFRAAFPAPRTVGVKMLDYPAPPVSVLTEKTNGNWASNAVQFFGTNLPRYLTGKDIGVVELHRQVAFSRNDCPNQRIVLAGYSQGAMVIHDFLLEYNATASDANKRAIKAVVLVADPLRFSNSRANNLGTAARGSRGVCGFVSVISCNRTQPRADIPVYYAPRTYSVCEQYDTVCDTSTAVGTFWSLGPDVIRAVGDTVHGLYPITQATRTAGQRAAQTVVSLP